MRTCFQRLKLKYDKPLLNLACKCILRLYILALLESIEPDLSDPRDVVVVDTRKAGSYIRLHFVG